MMSLLVSSRKASMDIIQKLLHKVSLGIPSSRPSRPPHHPSLNTPEQWQAYWAAQGQPWRKEPEIDLPRQAELAQRRDIVPDVKQGSYPLKGMQLSRADVEWLLATHENGRGPVDWSDEGQRGRNGLDLRGADLHHVDLSHLPLSRLCGGYRRRPDESWNEASDEELHAAAAILNGADLRSTHLEDADLCGVYLQDADLRAAHLEQADFCRAHLEGVRLHGANLKFAYFRAAYLERANLFRANLEHAILMDAYLGGAILVRSSLEEAELDRVILSDEKHGCPRVADVRWGNVNLAAVKWSQVKMLGDEQRARQKTREGIVKSKALRLREYEQAVRANRQLAVTLQAQGLNEQAARFAYRAQVLQRRAFWFEAIQQKVKLRQRGQALGAWLFSWFLFLLAGYGYKPERSFLVYLLVIMGFTALYLGLGGHLAWYEAVVVSMTAFHGRGFSPSTFSPGDPLSIASAFEAFVGLIIEVTFIATLTQRFFNR
jgi:uncharacterized protein YjbI with pentapeptide repeats